ncbi:hypothetical protein FRC17_006632 [Serendipita sp. 399]|nr:hypothetical protein FRC17_006632 [Serendipita sp. 399]
MTALEPRIPDAEPTLNALSALVAPNCAIALNSTEGQAYADSLFAHLKSLHREAHATVRHHKQQTASARALMDESLLKLQNLRYERRHLEKEIENCREYGSIYQDVTLHPLEEFMELAPSDSKTEDTVKDEHQLFLARLSFELAERKRLEEMKLQLQKERDELLAVGQAKGAKEEDWDKRTETLAKQLVELRRSLD